MILQFEEIVQIKFKFEEIVQIVDMEMVGHADCVDGSVNMFILRICGQTDTQTEWVVRISVSISKCDSLCMATISAPY